MKPFHTIAIPHQDILEGRLTMDVFAADLWQVVNNRGPDEYKDAETFFNKTYVTQGLDNLLTVVKKRLEGKGGDSFIQLQTPFGGGKTHALIALYHKSSEWGAKRIVIDGTALSAEQTIWGVFEQSLKGGTALCKGQTSPGKEIIRKLLSAHQPLVILVDELLEYTTKAAGVNVGSSNLASQTIAFMHELTETVSTLERVCLLVTLPASLMEHYDEEAEKLFQKLQKVSGRREKIYTPVEENEISSIIRRRLFSRIDMTEAKEVVNSFVTYADRENILPGDGKPSEYRERFENSYPFMPEVIDILYHRWGSFHTFQRTRGVLRLLSLVVYQLKSTDKPYIGLADFDLSRQELRQELLKHIGQEFNSIIGADISGNDAGAKKVNKELGRSYQGLTIGTRTAATIFLYSFSGGPEHGATLGEIKRSATTLQNPSPLVAEAVEQLKTKLFYLQSKGDKYFFSNQANLNRILLNNMENVRGEDLTELELELLRSSLKGHLFKTYIWEDKSSNITDSEELKLVVLRKADKSEIREILKSKGHTPRVYRNTIFFLYPLETERSSFLHTLKRKIAFENIAGNEHLQLTEEQKKEVKEEIKKLETPLQDAVRRLYRTIAIPDKDGFREKDLGIPTYGLNKRLDEEVFDQLRLDGEILERFAPIVLKEKYLKDKEYVLTDRLYQSTLKTPGEARPVNRTVLEYCIREGVQMGLFGLGELEDDRPKCVYFKESATISFAGKEIIIKDEICAQQKGHTESDRPKWTSYVDIPPKAYPINDRGADLIPAPVQPGETSEQVCLKFLIPRGKVSQIMGIMNLLQSKFTTLEVTLSAKEGSISKQDIEDKIKETFRQLNIDFTISEG
ncbi:MAG: AAA family ATPase [Spirochaetes bacterium]|nr:MAG: AAA family ATPase [Spirochaetota bacterium]